jgi:hypothetical protein
MRNLGVQIVQRDPLVRAERGELTLQQGMAQRVLVVLAERCASLKERLGQDASMLHVRARAATCQFAKRKASCCIKKRHNQLLVARPRWGELPQNRLQVDGHTKVRSWTRLLDDALRVLRVRIGRRTRRRPDVGIRFRFLGSLDETLPDHSNLFQSGQRTWRQVRGAGIGSRSWHCDFIHPKRQDKVRDTWHWFLGSLTVIVRKAFSLVQSGRRALRIGTGRRTSWVPDALVDTQRRDGEPARDGTQSHMDALGSRRDIAASATFGSFPRAGTGSSGGKGVKGTIRSSQTTTRSPPQIWMRGGRTQLDRKRRKQSWATAIAGASSFRMRMGGSLAQLNLGVDERITCSA